MRFAIIMLCLLIVFFSFPDNYTARRKKKHKGKFFNVTIHRFCDYLCTFPREEEGKFVTYHHVACNCSILPAKPTLDLVETDQISFRQAILDRFNEFRNRIASGKTHLPPAADMVALNYYVGLEYMAYCSLKLKSAQMGDQLRCSADKYNDIAQPLLFNEDNIIDLENVASILEYLEVQLQRYKKLTPESIDGDLSNVTSEGAQTLLYLLNSRLNEIGCYRRANPNAKIPRFKYVILCYLNSFKGSPVKDIPVYRKGTPCSKCPEEDFTGTELLNCGSRFASLCGDDAPVPVYPWGSSRETEIKIHDMYLLVMVTYLVL